LQLKAIVQAKRNRESHECPCSRLFIFLPSQGSGHSTTRKCLQTRKTGIARQLERNRRRNKPRRLHPAKDHLSPSQSRNRNQEISKLQVSKTLQTEPYHNSIPLPLCFVHHCRLQSLRLPQRNFPRSIFNNRQRVFSMFSHRSSILPFLDPPAYEPAQ